jgi:uncharacterized membrane protein YwzB
MFSEIQSHRRLLMIFRNVSSYSKSVFKQNSIPIVFLSCVLTGYLSHFFLNILHLEVS